MRHGLVATAIQGRLQYDWSLEASKNARTMIRVGWANLVMSILFLQVDITDLLEGWVSEAVLCEYSMS